jgi:hypothetical protein
MTHSENSQEGRMGRDGFLLSISPYPLPPFLKVKTTSWSSWPFLDHSVQHSSQHPGKINIHNHRNLETRKPGRKVPEILGMEKPRCGRKGWGK